VPKKSNETNRGSWRVNEKRIGNRVGRPKIIPPLPQSLRQALKLTQCCDLLSKLWYSAPTSLARGGTLRVIGASELPLIKASGLAADISETHRMTALCKDYRTGHHPCGDVLLSKREVECDGLLLF